MELKLNKLAKMTMPVLATSLLMACGGGSSGGGADNGGADNKVIEGLYEAAENEVVVYYKREEAHSTSVDEAVYDGWGLYLWNNAACNGVDLVAMGLADANENSNNDWNSPLQATGFSETYGAYYVLKTIEDSTNPHSCMNFIISDMGASQSADLKIDFNLLKDSDSKGIFNFAGSSELYYTPMAERPVAIDGAKAHWITPDTIAWEAVKTAASYELRYDLNAGITLDPETKEVAGGTVIALSKGEISEQAKKDFPHLANWPAAKITVEEGKLDSVLQSQLIVIAYNEAGEPISATQVQTAGVIDDVYVDGEDGAMGAELGAIVSGTDATFKLWAPTAQSVRLLMFKDDLSADDVTPIVELTRAANGVWSGRAENVVGKFYRYEVKVYHPVTGKVETHQVTDPYSLSLSTNSLFSQVVDLNNPELMPEGWAESNGPNIDGDINHVLYESHLRDFSFSDTLGTADLNGKYLALKEEERESVKHLKELKAAGLTTLHILPAFDIATVNEDPSKVVNIDDTIGKLCELNTNASVCGEVANDKVIEDVLASYDGTTGDAQALMNDLRNLDSFNWGYDPFHYTVPEGSYATDAHGTTRILEFREMVKASHDMGLKLIMDVVYNHTNASGVNDKSVLDKIVPGYYHRLNINTGAVEMSTCCDNTATENAMMGKLMIDSLVTWAQDYKVDGFRFDLMGHQPKALMVDALAEVRKVDEDTFFYGEGWDFGEVTGHARFEQAIQWNMAGTEIATFSDRLRDAVRGGSPFDNGVADDKGVSGIRSNQGFANAAVLNEQALLVDDLETDLQHGQDLIRVGMAGNLRDFIILDSQGRTKRGQDVDYGGAPAGYTQLPSENISYVSKHDNQTLWDNNAYKIADSVTADKRARMQAVALSTVMLGQGVPFIHMGSEILRSKSMQRDSYDSGDWFNRVRFDYSDNNWNVGLPRKDKDGDNWPLIKEILTDVNAAPVQDDIELTKAQFLDLLKIRSSSPLFRLKTADEVKARVDFHNTGLDQVTGLIVMSIDNGTSAGADLDENLDAIVVMLNATDAEQAFTIEDATGFELHSVQQTSADSDVQGASFADGTFSVPALTSAVFVMPRGEARSAGLAVDMSDKDLSSIPPFGNTQFYLRGVENSWGNDYPLQFTEQGKYTVTVNYSGDEVFAPGGLVVATEGWETKYEGCTQETALTLDNSANVCSSVQDVTKNFAAAFTEAGLYHFTFDASNQEALTVSVVYEEPAAQCEVLPSVEGGSLADNPHFVRGDLTEWAAVENSVYQMRYKGLDGDKEIYQAVFEFEGDAAFKIASSDDDWASQYFVHDATGSLATLMPELAYDLSTGDAGMGNNEITLEKGNWSFLMKIDPEAQDGVVGSLIVQECSQ